ncbi:MAG: hypothetical protein ACLGSH_10725 [Acidobacteriota bacterium]
MASSVTGQSEAITAKQVDESVIAALAPQGVAKPAILAHIDLTKPFNATSQWTFVVVQESVPPQAAAMMEDKGQIFVCLVKGVTPDCVQDFYAKPNSDQPRPDAPFHLLASSIVHSRDEASSALLLVRVCGPEGYNGNCAVATALYKYDRRTDNFLRVFLNITGRNNNEATRFVDRGPLQGYVVVDYPTQNPPYVYWVEVYRAGPSGQYARILRYRGRTRYGDGNPLAVADSEMPEILRRLGMRKASDPLPVPAHLPQGCSHLVLLHGEEWCR